MGVKQALRSWLEIDDVEIWAEVYQRLCGVYTGELHWKAGENWPSIASIGLMGSVDGLDALAYCHVRMQAAERGADVQIDDLSLVLRLGDIDKDFVQRQMRSWLSATKYVSLHQDSAGKEITGLLGYRRLPVNVSQWQMFLEDVKVTHYRSGRTEEEMLHRVTIT